MWKSTKSMFVIPYRRNDEQGRRYMFRESSIIRNLNPKIYQFRVKIVVEVSNGALMDEIITWDETKRGSYEFMFKPSLFIDEKLSSFIKIVLAFSDEKLLNHIKS